MDSSGLALWCWNQNIRKKLGHYHATHALAPYNARSYGVMVLTI